MPPATLTVESSSSGREVWQVFLLRGVLMRESLSSFEQAMRENRSPTTILDLRQVEYIDRAGVEAIVAAHRSHALSGRRLALVGNRRTAELFSIEGPVPTVFESMTEAEETLAP